MSANRTCRWSVVTASVLGLAVAVASVMWLEAPNETPGRIGDPSEGAAPKAAEANPVSLPLPRLAGAAPLSNAGVVAEEVARNDAHASLGRRLTDIYAAMQPYQRAWNRDELYARHLRPVVADMRPDDLVETLTATPPDDGMGRHEAAVARVIGLKAFDLMVEVGRLDDAAQVLGRIVVRAVEGGVTPRNVELDVERMMRTYFTARAEQAAIFGDVALLAGELEELGFPLDRLLRERMSTRLSAGILRGLAMAYLSSTGSLDFEKWITQA